MKTSIAKKIWFLIAASLSTCVGYCGCKYPENFEPLVDLVATILAIFIGITLAIFGILGSSPSLGTTNYRTDEEKSRMLGVLSADDQAMTWGQNIIFYCFYVALIFAVVLKAMTIFDQGSEAICFQILLHIISGFFSFLGTYSLMWSATLPRLLQQVSYQRRTLA